MYGNAGGFTSVNLLRFCLNKMMSLHLKNKFMKKSFFLLCLITTLLRVDTMAQKGQSQTASVGEVKPRTIVTCDPELDDNNSMIRFILHATDFQIDGLVYTSSRFHWKGDGKGTTQFIE